jgi:hypothetical protein
MRAYAPFFEWFDKGQKELGVVEELVKSLKLAGFADLRKPRLNRPDPPDCVCENQLGDRVAVEVAEVVCERAARLTAQGEDVFRRWRDGELRVHIDRLLGEKDRKRYLGGPYSETILCLFTDEPMPTLDQAKSDLSDAKFGPFHQLTSGFLLLSYNPGTKSYPTLQLPFAV